MKYILATIGLSLLLLSCQSTIKTHHDSGELHEQYREDDDGRRHGDYMRYDLDGTLRERAAYTHGQLDGVRTLYYEGGELEISETYVLDGLQGPYKKYYPSGQVQFEITYTDNTMMGPSQSYYADGTLRETVLFENNNENGPFIEYHPNGKLHWEGTYKDGDNEVGLLKEYNEEGLLIKKMQCDDRSICRTVWTLSEGEVLPSTDI